MILLPDISLALLPCFLAFHTHDWCPLSWLNTGCATAATDLRIDLPIYCSLSPHGLLKQDLFLFRCLVYHSLPGVSNYFTSSLIAGAFYLLTFYYFRIIVCLGWDFVLEQSFCICVLYRITLINNSAPPIKTS